MEPNKELLENSDIYHNEQTKMKLIPLPKNMVKQPILLPKNPVKQPILEKTEEIKDELVRVGQTAIKWVGSDQYAVIISQIGPEKGIVYLTQYRPSDIRAKKNMKGIGYGEQRYNKATGKWEYSDSSKYRGLSTWYPIEGKVETVLSREF